jgi:hypothetical protein
VVDLLVPNNPGNDALSFNVSGTQGGTSNSSAIPSTAETLFSSTAWTGGKLDAYLGFSASPANPIGAYLDADEATLDPTATGFFVYQADLGQNQLQDNPDALSGPLLNLNKAVPVGTYILGFCMTCSKKGDNVATANSGAILETNGIPVPPVPEPNSLLWLTPVAIGLAGRAWIKRRA